MKPISISTQADRFVISIDKNHLPKEVLLQFVDQLRVEALAQQVDFSEDIEALGEEIKAAWWEAHKSRFISEKEA